MLTLILMRHAKSSWADRGQADVDRPLNARGRRASAAVGDWLASKGLIPAAALVSAAARTRETWERLGPGFADVPARFLPELYHAGPETLLRVLRAAPQASPLLLLGHQPGIGEAALRLLAALPDDPDYARYPTAATAVIAFEAPAWSAVAWGSGRLADFVTPAALAAGDDD
ncbi:histidine phosphatase family protein [Amaricoccus sp.]|uniref:SixA phosphatase family protein n=1 Tax=Amaricoccus sp. TaxID=1872485 RepID=UPI001B70986E|nr:histidine phosphatase family protein [Amaricoccus sp.]MBP7000098.1 histidine phosphatase family protein [Amaricoccus sp.]